MKLKNTALLMGLIALGLSAQTSSACSKSVPDGGSTVLLLAAAWTGLSWACKRLRR
ncbi:MAG: hypothetical protein ACLQVY_03495 [Limisphaerales bacterium]